MPSKDSKNNFALLRDKILSQNGKEYWRSVEEFADAPEFEEFIKQEYPAQAEEWDSSLSRRNFVKVMGASLALAGLSGCVIQPPEKIVPYVTQPENLIPGKSLFFATTMTLGGIAMGLLGESADGRPIKVEGNPEHPGSLGATDVLAQASVLTMYDPDRSQEVRYRGTANNWQNFMTEVRSAVEQNAQDGGAGVRFLTETVTSPTMIAQFEQIAKDYPNARWVQYEPFNWDNQMTGAKMALGSAANTVYKFDEADRILSLDADIFSNFNVRYIKDFNKKRAWGEGVENINRLYAVETTMTLTGAKADHRLAVKPSQMVDIAKAIAAAIGVSGASSGYTGNAEFIMALANDLKANAGKSIVVAGDNQPPTVHALAHAMNAQLGNVGKTLVYTEPLAPFADTSQTDQLRELIADIDAGRVKTLVIMGGNPVYSTPADLKLNLERLEKIPLRIHSGLYFNETAELCHWHIPETHYLEMWGDAKAYDGTISIMQPLIKPLYGGKSQYEIAQVFLKENYDKPNYDIVKEYWQTHLSAGAPKTMAAGTTPSASPSPNASPSPEMKATPQATPTPTTSPSPNASPETQSSATPAASPSPQNATTGAATAPKTFEDNWRKIVHDGFIANSGLPAKTLSASTAFLNQPENKPQTYGALEVSFMPDPCVYDGRFTNNGWLQELPNPLTKITWENVALVSPATAKRLELNITEDKYHAYAGGEMGAPFFNTKGGNQFSDLVRLSANGAEIPQDVPVWVAPGQPDDVITIYAGYGRPKAGRVGNGLGYNAYAVRSSSAMYFGSGELKPTGAQTSVASTQIHFNMEGRDLLRVWDVEEFKAHPNMGEQHDEYENSMYEPYNYSQHEWQHKWAMTIDLNSCVGCNACVLACQAENNIPVVGKEQVERSREMHWMRVDAYFGGTDVNNPEGPSFQPVLCQQCEQAPCEVVCPVHATVHSAEGLNDMVYNRCIGTRYCSNNCPYKVRRFNFLLYQDWNTPQYKLLRNPEVTVRSRGVMEKCTYCVQRIALARIEAEKDGRRVRDGEVVTACQAVCPADAIVFGDLNDENSRVSKSKKDERNYILLNELNTQPRTTYLAALKNQNKEIPGYKGVIMPDEEKGVVGNEENTSEVGH